MIEHPDWGNMTQMDLFDETLQKKIVRLEKWILRLQKEMWWLKSICELKQSAVPSTTSKPQNQLDIFNDFSA